METTQTYAISRRAVLENLKSSKTVWPEIKAWFSNKGLNPEIPASEIAGKIGIEAAIWSLRTLPVEHERAARGLAAAFAMGPNDELAEAFAAATKGSATFREGCEALIAWIDGDLPDEEAAKMRYRLSVESLASKEGPYNVLQAIGSGFAPHAWGGCLCAHDYARTAHQILLAKKGVTKAEAASRADAYHLFLIEDMFG